MSKCRLCFRMSHTKLKPARLQLNYSKKKYKASISDSKVKIAHVILYSDVISGLIAGFIKLSSLTVWINLAELFNAYMSKHARLHMAAVRNFIVTNVP